MATASRVSLYRLPAVFWGYLLILWLFSPWTPCGVPNRSVRQVSSDRGQCDMTYFQEIDGAKRSMFWGVGSRIRVDNILSEINQRPRGDARRNCFVCLEKLQRAKRTAVPAKSSLPSLSSNHLARNRRCLFFVCLFC